MQRTFKKIKKGKIWLKRQKTKRIKKKKQKNISEEDKQKMKNIKNI